MLRKILVVSLAIFAMGTQTGEAKPLTPQETDEEKALQAIYPGYGGVDLDYRHAGKKALERWQDMKYGLHIHWGLYTLVGGHESWCLAPGATGKYPSKEFQQFYGVLYHYFNPEGFDADEWMELIKRGGMKYFTFTTKHHDGFCMWATDTKQKSLKMVNGYGKYEEVLINYSVMDTPYKKDIVRMLVEAGRRHGLGVGLYFSHIDWHDPDFAWDPRNFHYTKEYTKESDPGRWQNFIEKERAQLSELLTRYGDIDLLSLDIAWPPAAQRDIYEVAKMCREIQPNILMRHRGIGPYGDYQTPERWIPGSKQDVRVDKPWQVIYPCGLAFSWLPNDKYKPASWILESLIDIVSKGGNFQVAFGPMPNGKWDEEQIKRIEYVGDWLKVNGEAIYESRTWPVFYEGDYVRFTRSKDWKYVYAICLEWPGEELMLTKVRAKEGTKIVMLGYKGLLGEKALKWHQDKDGLVIEIPKELQEEDNRPCKQAYVFKIQAQPFKEKYE